MYRSGQPPILGLARKPKRKPTRYEKPILKFVDFFNSFLFLPHFFLFLQVRGFCNFFRFSSSISVVLFHIGPLSPTTDIELSVSVGKPRPDPSFRRGGFQYGVFRISVWIPIFAMARMSPRESHFGSRRGPMGTKLAHVQFTSSRSIFTTRRRALDLLRYHPLPC